MLEYRLAHVKMLIVIIQASHSKDLQHCGDLNLVQPKQPTVLVFVSCGFVFNV
jgi:hypothetical protein